MRMTARYNGPSMPSHRSYRIGRDGFLEAEVRGVTIKVDVTARIDEDGKLQVSSFFTARTHINPCSFQLSAAECDTSIEGIELAFRPSVPDEISDDIRAHLFHNFSVYICQTIDSAIESFGAETDEIFSRNLWVGSFI